MKTNSCRKLYGGVIFTCFSIVLPTLVLAATERDEQYAERLYLQGMEDFRRQDFGDAAELFEKSFELSPNSIRAYALAWTSANLRYARGARYYALKALSLDPPLDSNRRRGANDLVAWADAYFRMAMESKADTLPPPPPRVRTPAEKSGSTKKQKQPKDKAGKHQQQSTSCYDSIQGKIAWNYSGRKTWDRKNVRNLCGKATQSREPGRCFDRFMHGYLGSAGGYKSTWQEGVALCKGATNSKRRLGCFEKYINAGYSRPDSGEFCGRCEEVILIPSRASCRDFYRQRAGWSQSKIKQCGLFQVDRYRNELGIRSKSEWGEFLSPCK